MRQLETTTRQSETTTRQPETTTRQPETTTRQPETTTRHTETTTRQPETYPFLSQGHSQSSPSLHILTDSLSELSSQSIPSMEHIPRISSMESLEETAPENSSHKCNGSEHLLWQDVANEAPTSTSICTCHRRDSSTKISQNRDIKRPGKVIRVQTMSVKMDDMRTDQKLLVSRVGKLSEDTSSSIETEGNMNSEEETRVDIEKSSSQTDIGKDINFPSWKVVVYVTRMLCVALKRIRGAVLRLTEDSENKEAVNGIHSITQHGDHGKSNHESDFIDSLGGDHDVLDQDHGSDFLTEDDDLDQCSIHSSASLHRTSSTESFEILVPSCFGNLPEEHADNKNQVRQHYELCETEAQSLILSKYSLAHSSMCDSLEQSVVSDGARGLITSSADLFHFDFQNLIKNRHLNKLNPDFQDSVSWSHDQDTLRSSYDALKEKAGHVFNHEDIGRSLSYERESNIEDDDDDNDDSDSSASFIILSDKI